MKYPNSIHHEGGDLKLKQEICDGDNGKLHSSIIEENEKFSEYFLEAPPSQNNVSRNAPFQCEICERSFKILGSLIQHTRLRHDPNYSLTFDCIFCKSTFNSNQVLNLHIISHIQERSLFCALCPDEFLTRKRLNCHHRRKHDPTRVKPFQCQICPSKFFTKSELQSHGQRMHLNVSQFHCDQCDKSFKEPSKLNLHMRRVHSNDVSAFACEVCGKGFKTSGDLKCHMVVHTGEKHHGCPFCSRKFAKRSELNIHIRSHTGERPFKCRDCNLTFSCQSSQCRHMKNFHK